MGVTAKKLLLILSFEYALLVLKFELCGSPHDYGACKRLTKWNSCSDFPWSEWRSL